MHLQNLHVWHARSSQHSSLPQLAPQDLDLSFSNSQPTFGFLVRVFLLQTNPGHHSGAAVLHLDPHCDECVLSPEKILHSSKEGCADEKTCEIISSLSYP